MRNNLKFCCGNSAEIINNVDSLVLSGSTVCFNNSNTIASYKGIIRYLYVGEVNPGVKQRLRWNNKKCEAYSPHYG